MPPVEDLAEVVAATVLAVPGVAALHGGTYGSVATYLPGRAVTGVRIRDGVTDVHVVLFWGAPVLATADSVRASVQLLVDGRVDVSIEDVVDPPPPPAELSFRAASRVSPSVMQSGAGVSNPATTMER